MKVKRGDIWFCNIPPSMENVQFGEKPVIIISNDKANFFSPTLTILPITSRNKNMFLHVPIMLDQQSWVVCEQLMTVNKKNLTRFKCKVSNDVMIEIEKAIDIQISRKNVFDINKINQMIRAIEELENFINKYGKQIEDMQEIDYSLKLHISELKSYCVKYGMDYKKFYNPVSGVREDASAV